MDYLYDSYEEYVSNKAKRLSWAVRKDPVVIRIMDAVKKEVDEKKGAWNAYRAQVEHLIDNKFPWPDDIDVQPETSDEVLHEVDVRELAHCAVNINDKDKRRLFMRIVINSLVTGQELSVVERAWLVYVLSRLNDMPHESKGAPVQGFEKREFFRRLAWFVRRSESRQPSIAVTKRLELAAEYCCKSYETVRSAYYSDDFKSLMDTEFAVPSDIRK